LITFGYVFDATKTKKRIRNWFKKT
jgi:hypothetical protein